jgi:hypothetical protein
VVAAIVHDLAGMLSNVSTFAGILEARPDHPGRGEFIPVLAQEAKAAAQAVKDLQLARALSEPWPRGDLAHVDVCSVLREVATDLGHPGWFDDGLSRVGPSESVVADGGVLHGLLERALAVASGGDPNQDSPLDIERSGSAVTLTFDLSRATYEGDVLADIGRGRRELRPFALLKGCVESWGGEGLIEAREGVPALVLRLAS